MGQADVDLSGLTVSDLNVSMGLGQTTVVLPAEGRLRVKISGAIGQTTIVVPAGMEARIQASTGIAARQVPAGYRKQDDVYTSPGYAGAENRVDLEVSQAMGEVTIRH
jgi:predicted membrane protein